MRNIAAIAGRELRAAFASPVAYIVLGLWALLFGIFFMSILQWFVERSMGMGQFGMGPGPVNINQDLIRYLMQQAAVVMLFLLPALTMRTYAEEKRTGTMELLLTSPLTDFQILMGKFLGVLAVYVAMLLVTWIHLGILFWYGDPEWRPLLAAYLGLLLLGASFISLGLFVSSLTRNQIVAVMGTFAVALALWIIDWLGEAGGSTARDVLAYISIIRHFEDFARGVIDTKHLVYYLSFITFGLFLTAKSVDSERWRG
jgi:ABC-2 type transport system permease protein